VPDQLGMVLPPVYSSSSRGARDLADDLVSLKDSPSGSMHLCSGKSRLLLAAEDVAGDVVLFQLGVDGEDDIGQQAVRSPATDAAGLNMNSMSGGAWP